MTAFWIFVNTYISVFAYGMQSQFVNNGNYFAAFGNGIIIGTSHYLLYKTMPDANPQQIAAFILAGPIAIISSMWAHRRFFKKR